MTKAAGKRPVRQLIFYIHGLQNLVPRLTLDTIERTRSPAQNIMLMISHLVKGLAIYQVLFLFFPNPLSSMALDMVSILSILIMIRGTSMDDADFRRFMSDTLRLISIPLACCALEISENSFWISGMYRRARDTEYAMEYLTPILFNEAANSLG